MYPDPDEREVAQGAFDDSPFGGLDADIFTREIENVSASDWDVDTDLLWGDPDAAGDQGADGVDSGFLA